MCFLLSFLSVVHSQLFANLSVMNTLKMRTVACVLLIMASTGLSACQQQTIDHSAEIKHCEDEFLKVNWRHTDLTVKWVYDSATYSDLGNSKGRIDLTATVNNWVKLVPVTGWCSVDGAKVNLESWSGF